MESVKIKIIRYDNGETKVYTDTLPPPSEDPNAFELYEVI